MMSCVMSMPLVAYSTGVCCELTSRISVYAVVLGVLVDHRHHALPQLLHDLVLLLIELRLGIFGLAVQDLVF